MSPSFSSVIQLDIFRIFESSDKLLRSITLLKTHHKTPRPHGITAKKFNGFSVSKIRSLPDGFNANHTK
ncbi:MAG: hypothetical protein DKT66_06190 [Candidatus Melainabacteria bacterium]|nr:MAG: hypothetical protein DKT66_06190 [Candidatus Melainabacteria bacterium]